MFTNITRVLVIAAFLGGCSSTQPVAAITKSGQILRGTATATLEQGSFEVTDGKLTCVGSYNPLTESTILSAKVTCNGGRTGFAIITRDAGLQSGSGRVRLNDGSDADLVFGAAARSL